MTRGSYLTIALDLHFFNMPFRVMATIDELLHIWRECS